MRNLLFTLVAVVLLATACGPDERATVQGAAAVRPLSETSGVAAESEQAHEPSRAAPQVDEPHATLAVTNATVCGFDEDLEPDRIEVAQIPGDGRENTVSALDFQSDERRIAVGHSCLRFQDHSQSSDTYGYIWNLESPN